MSETSQSVGRIAVLTAVTLLFAAAWRGDAPQSVRSSSVLASIRRQSGAALETASRGAIADGLIAARPMSAVGRLPAAGNGRLLVGASGQVAKNPEPAALFSGTPALLGRSTEARGASDALATASAAPEATR